MDRHLLIIDDEPGIGAFLCKVAEGLGFVPFAVDSSEAFWSRYDAIEPAVIVLDLKMPNADGVEILRALSERKSRAQIVVISGSDQRVLHSALRLGSDRGLHMVGTLQKPMHVRDIQDVLGKVSPQWMPIGESELRQAIESNEIVVQYQPKVGLSDGRAWRVLACEALARWDHPERGLLGPDKFIGLAETTKLIGPLTDAILGQTVRQLDLWREQGHALTASVNLSPQLLSDLELPDRYEDLCRSSGIQAAQLTIEITESGVMSDVALTTDILTRFRLKGFGLSLDDFGTGYSSLVQLYRMPFNELKVDKSFVIDSDTNEEARAIVRSIAGLAHNLGLTVCAEGVETEQALALVRDVGCHTCQGYLIAKPMPAAKLSAFLQDGIATKTGQPAA